MDPPPASISHRETSEGDGEIVGVVQIPSVLKYEVDSLATRVDVDDKGLDGVRDGLVQFESRRSRVNEEGDEKGEKEDGGDGDYHVTYRPLGLETLVRKRNYGREKLTENGLLQYTG